MRNQQSQSCNSRPQFLPGLPALLQSELGCESHHLSSRWEGRELPHSVGQEKSQEKSLDIPGEILGGMPGGIPGEIPAENPG